MKIAIVSLVLIESNKLNFYNPQNIGLGRAFAQLGHEVILYSFEKRKIHEIVNTSLEKGVLLRQIGSYGIGNNALGITKFLDNDINVVICFSDIQIEYCRLKKWCDKQKKLLFPYVGVIESRQNNKIGKILMQLLAKRNLDIYKKQIVFSKSEKIYKALKNYNIETILTPVGLDLSQLHSNYKYENKMDIKKELGLGDVKYVILFVARLVSEKRPIELIEIFEKIYSVRKDIHLCIVGNGTLKEKAKHLVVKKGLNDAVRFVDSVPNKNMWKYYIACDWFVNLNIGEIFGMAILEAMYYEMVVVARHAPGPNMIINNSVSGFLCNSNQEIINAILSSNKNLNEIKKQAHKDIMDKFTWNSSANIMLDTIHQIWSKQP